MVDLSGIEFKQNDDGSFYAVDKETKQFLSYLQHQELSQQLMKGARVARYAAAREEVCDCAYWWWSNKYADMSKSGDCIYFVDGGQHKPGLIKIGKTSRLPKRLGELRNKYGSSLHLLLWIPVNDLYYAEVVMHDLLETHRVEGEWFSSDAVWQFLSCYGDDDCVNQIS